MACNPYLYGRETERLMYVAEVVVHVVEADCGHVILDLLGERIRETRIGQPCVL